MRHAIGVVCFAGAVVLQPLALFGGLWLLELVAGVLFVSAVRMMGDESE